MGGMGGRGGFHGGRGGRGERGDQPRDSASSAHRENTGTLADLALRHRSDLQLTDSQATVIGNVAQQARADRINATEALAALRDTAAQPATTVTPQNDSTRQALLQHRRAVAAALAQLHDVDVNARTATLAVLSPAQQSTLAKLESAQGASGGGNGGYADRGERGGRGTPRRDQ